MVLVFALDGTDRATFRMTSDSASFGRTQDGTFYSAVLYTVERHADSS